MNTEKPLPVKKSNVLSGKSAYSPEDDAVICNAVKRNAVASQAFREASAKLGKPYEAVKSRYYRLLRKIKAEEKKPENVLDSVAKPTVPEAIAEMVQEKGLRHVQKEDLAEIAEKTGEHYHSVLSSWGNVWSNLNSEKHQKDCYWCKARAITQMRAEGLTYEEIGKRLQMNHATVANLHKVYRLFPNHRDALPISCYIAIARAETAEPPEEWAAFAEENHLSVRALQEALKMPLRVAKEKFGKQEGKAEKTHSQGLLLGEDHQEAQQKIASLYTTVYGLQQDLKGLNALVSDLQEEKAALWEGLREQHRKAVSLLKKAHARERALLSVLKAVAEEAGVPAGWKRAADVTAEDANKLVKAVRGAKKLNMVYAQMLKNKNTRKAAKKGA